MAMIGEGDRVWFLWSVVSSIVVVALLRFLVVVWWTPLRIGRCMRAQGIVGPPYKLVRGNAFEVARMMEEAKAFPPLGFSHHIVPRILPHITQWSEQYGKIFIYWFGPKAQLVITEPELIKEIFLNKHENYPKPKRLKLLKQLTGIGLLGVNGAKWARQRKLANHAFHAQNIKGMVHEMVICSQMMVDKWQLLLSSSPCRRQKIEVSEEFRVLTSDVIARTAFGSNYSEAKHIFDLQSQQAIIMSPAMQTVRHRIPGYSFIPTKENLKLNSINKEIQRHIKKMIESRVEMENRGVELEEKKKKDLLGFLLDANNEEEEKSRISLQTIVDECKTFFVAGQETTTKLLTWTFILLAAHKDWQESARKEVEEVLQGQPPNSDTLTRLKIVNMVLFEALRLYPSVISLTRTTIRDSYIGNIFVPKGVELIIPIPAIHHDQAQWGHDVEVFNPGRFADGMAKAGNHSSSFMGFSMGPRVCIGQNFALNEAKIAISMILQRFSIDVCSEYVHSPMHRLGLHPQHGAHVIVQKL